MAQLDIWMYIVSIFFENSYMYKYQVEMCSVDGVINERERARVLVDESRLVFQMKLHLKPSTSFFYEE
jgi:hypothetical protein